MNRADKVKQREGISPQSSRALDYVNFFLADVRDGIGPYLGIFLIASHHWDEAQVGIAMSAAGFAGVFAQTPMGWLVDKTKYKRIFVAVSSALIALACVAMTLRVTMPVIVGAQIVVGAVAAFIGPAMAAITLGLVGHKKLDRRVGRNESINHAGNVFAALAAGLLGHFVGREYIFYLVAVMAIFSIWSILRIKENEIDHDLARGATDEKPEDDDKDGVIEPHEREKAEVSSWTDVFKDRRVMIFAVAVIIFHFANAAMLPLAGQMLTEGKESGASLYMSACIIVAQLVMIPVAAWAGRSLGNWGRRPVMLIAFAALPVRGLLYVLSDNPYFIVSVQILDGIAGGIFGIATLIMISDLTKGTGRFNLTQGAIGTATGIGASFSTLVTGFIVKAYGFGAGFGFLAVMAFVALLIFYFFVAETKAGINRTGELKAVESPV